MLIPLLARFSVNPSSVKPVERCCLINFGTLMQTCTQADSRERRVASSVQATAHRNMTPIFPLYDAMVICIQRMVDYLVCEINFKGVYM